MKLDKKSAKKKIPPIITSLFKEKKFDLIHFEVMLTDIKENPPIDLSFMLVLLLNIAAKS